MNFKQIGDNVELRAQAYFGKNKMSAEKQFILERKIIDDYINEGYRLFSARSRVVKKIDETSIITTANTAIYTLPTGLFDIVGIIYHSGTDFWEISRINWGEIRNAKNLTGSPCYYEPSFGDQKITLYPAPQYSAEYLEIYGVWIPTDLSAETDIPLIPSHYHQALVDYADFKTQEFISFLSQNDKDGGFRTYSAQKEQAFLKRFYDLALDCLKEVEFGSDDRFKLFTEEELKRLNWGNKLPSFDHNPIISLLRFTTKFECQDTTTGTIRLKVDATGIYVNGLKLTFLGHSGTANFAGLGGSVATTVTIPDQGSTAAYDVKWTALGDSSIVGTVGEVTITKVSGTQFEVYNSGLATSAFYYEISNS